MAFSADLTPLGNFRRNYWKFYSERFPSDLELRQGYARSNAFENIGNLTISPYLSYRGVGVYVRDKGSYVGAPQSEPVHHCNALLKERGMEGWQGFDANERENWPAMVKWMHETLLAYREVAESVTVGPVDTTAPMS